ncbi:MAG TPA: response regulator [Ktedonobacterales bacterium]|nr:response regulator [Ktedonobacterales bacterium]
MSAPPSSLPVVLLVEDNKMLLDVLLTILPRLAPYQFIGVPDGVTGLEQCYALRPVCIIVDIMMPGLNGYQLARALRGDAETASIPLIILSALAQEQEQFAGLAAGADQYLIKPVTPQLLVAAIEQAIAISEVERAEHWQALAATMPADEGE